MRDVTVVDTFAQSHIGDMSSLAGAAVNHTATSSLAGATANHTATSSLAGAAANHTATSSLAGATVNRTATSSLAGAAANHAATSSLAGAAANHAATLKTFKYANITDTNIFLPIAIETGGAWDQQAIEFIQEIGKRISVVLS